MWRGADPARIEAQGSYQHGTQGKPGAGLRAFPMRDASSCIRFSLIQTRPASVAHACFRLQIRMLLPFPQRLKFSALSWSGGHQAWLRRRSRAWRRLHHGARRGRPAPASRCRSSNRCRCGAADSWPSSSLADTCAISYRFLQQNHDWPGRTCVLHGLAWNPVNEIDSHL